MDLGLEADQRRGQQVGLGLDRVDERVGPQPLGRGGDGERVELVEIYCGPVDLDDAPLRDDQALVRAQDLDVVAEVAEEVDVLAEHVRLGLDGDVVRLHGLVRREPGTQARPTVGRGDVVVVGVGRLVAHLVAARCVVLGTHRGVGLDGHVSASPSARPP
nr:hypothetical protein [Arsenicicoccus piscis]